MKVFLFLKIILTFLILHSFAYSKGLPPGTGSNDIPANVLILLDKSGSMSTTISTGGINKPQAIAVDSTDSASYVGMSSFIAKVDYDTMQVDDTWAFAASGNCLMANIKELRIHNNKLYVIDYNSNRLFRIDLTSKICDWSVSISNPRGMDIKNNILYTAGGGMLVYDLSNATPSLINCTYNGNLRSDGLSANSLAIDSSGSNLYFHKSGKLNRYEIQGSNCPNTTRSNQITTSGVSTTHGFIFKPGSDTIIYMPDYNDEFYKFTLNSSLTTASRVKANVGYSGTAASTTNPNRTNVDYPYGIDIDATNQRIHLVSRGCCKHAMHVIDYDMQFVKEITGGSGTSRMQGAVEAIQAIVTDSGLTSHVNFGFGVWSESGASFSGWNGDITNGTATPCGDKNCLKVRVHREGAAKINTVAPTISANGSSTFSKSFADLGEDYFLHGSLSPVDTNLTCQNSHIIVIGDGDFTDQITSAKNIISNLNLTHSIKTHMIGYGGGISSGGLLKFEEFAVAGGTNDIILANTPNSLKSQLRAKITQLIADNFAFTAPSIPPNKNETSTAVYQSSFKHKSNQAWRGALIRTAIDANGNLLINDADNWKAKDVVPSPDDRKIWSVIPNTDYTTDYNNIVEANSSDITNSLKTFGYDVADYHSVSNNPAATRRCAGSAAGIQNGNEDDTKGLINFLRGEDYFDYDGDCNLTETRLNEDSEKVYLGDFYHSELLVVGAPDANTSFTNKAQEAYWRSSKGYDNWAASANLKNRKEIIYVGANDGMLHAFNSENGIEEWAFIPPLLLGNIATMTDKMLNKAAGGGTHAIYGVDGSPVVHDMFFKGPFDNAKVWHTILFVPYGRGGNGFSILDVTNPDAPLHLFSVFNDSVTNDVYVMNEVGETQSYEYVASSYNINQLKEAITVTGNFSSDPKVGNEICDNTANNQCYLSNTWTLVTNPKVPGLTNNDFRVNKEGINYNNFTTAYDANGDIVFTFGDTMRYVAYDGSGGGDTNLASTDLSIFIETASAATGVQAEPGYDYSRLGETWSQPRIIRMPNFGSDGTDIEDNNIEDDIYVAVLGGGFGAQNPALGSNLYVINLDEVDPADNLYGKIRKEINIQELDNDIINSTPALPVVITADEISANYTGALVYLNDLEGKITKFNLTNMTKDNQGVPIAIYDSTTLFNVGATKTNGRYMYHSMDAGTLKGSNRLWMYVGTGDYERLTTKSADIDNLLLGIRDKDFPYYRNVNTVVEADDLTDCSDTTDDSSGSSCPSSAQLGWVIHLDDSEKVTAEPTLSKGRVLFPIFQPTQSVNSCSTGKAFICNVDAKCGSPKNTEIGSANDNDCLEVGQGVLSKIIVFGDKLFANIAGTANEDSSQGERTDLVSITAGNSEIESFRNSWRENY